MCRSFISIIFPGYGKKDVRYELVVSILYKYHISRIGVIDLDSDLDIECRSFISIIFPPVKRNITSEILTVSILYKYHISRISLIHICKYFRRGVDHL